jgi:BirA family biotin operon repressor/biotin-[acetyl-CoA-carboxylase] ligase
VLTWYDALPSTQDEAHRLASEGAPHGTAIAARIQTGGRGTRGRSWVSAAGGLWLSVVCRPAPGTGLPVTGIRIGLALAEYLSTLGPPVRLKWPNDLMLGEGKLGGILCEARWQGAELGWIAAGIGLNLHNPLPPAGPLPPARLADWGSAATPEAIAPEVVARVSAAARQAAPLDDRELAAFASRDWLRGRPVLAPLPGRAMGITREGKLRVRGPDGSWSELDDSAGLRLA